MRIVSRVAAAFCRPDRSIIFEVRPADILVILDAPDEIRQDPLFTLMVNEGSLEVISGVDVQKKLEADPVQGANAEGRKISAPADDPEADKPADAPATRKSGAKAAK